MARSRSSTAADEPQNAETETETQTVENPQAPEHPETGEGEQAGSATGEHTEHGAEEGKSDVGAQTAEGEGATTTHLESVQRSGDLSGATGEIPAGSTGTRSPDAELANNLDQANKTAERTEQQVEDRQAGAERRSTRKVANDKEKLEELNAELAETQAHLDQLLAYRDRLRTEHDRLTERMSAASLAPFGDITSSYFAAADKTAAEEAATRKQLASLGLAALTGRSA